MLQVSGICIKGTHSFTCERAFSAKKVGFFLQTLVVLFIVLVIFEIFVIFKGLLFSADN
jgi:hypothetical protein